MPTIIGAKGNKLRLFQIKRAVRTKPKISEVERRERQDSLTRLGFLSYNGYTRSKLWKGIRERVLERDNHICLGCGDPATQVHHRAYDYPTLSGENLTHLQSACSSCHLASHAGGIARTIKVSEKTLKRRRKQRKKKGKGRFKRFFRH